MHQSLVARAGDPALREKAALIVEGTPHTYGELLDSARRLAAALVERGVRPGDRVAVYMDNSWFCAVSIYATWLAGAVILLINPQTKRDKLGFILDDSGARMLLTDGHIAKEFLPVLSAASSSLGVICSGSVPDGHGIDSLEALLRDTPPRHESPATIALDLAALIYTSGSTGQPKGVMQTHQSMLFAAGSLVEYLRLDRRDVILCVLPLAFDYGLYQLLMSVYLGATLVLERSFTYPAQVFARMRAYKVTVFPGVPTIFAMLLSAHEREALCFEGITRVTNTAAALSDSSATRLRTIFPHALIYKMYGLTECKRVSYLEPELVDARPGSVGKAIPGTEVYLLNADGSATPVGDTGILHVRGPHVMLGYWNRPDLSEQMLRPGKLPGERVLCTQDQFRMDGDGFLYFVGRSDEIIKTRGEKVSPVEVENAMAAIAGIREVAVVGVDDELWGQAVRAYVVLEADASLSTGQIRAQCIARLENFMVPQQIIVCADLPRTVTGKVSKAALLAWSDDSGQRMKALYRSMLERLDAGLELLPDKPEENVENTLRALWLAAAGKARSVRCAMQGELPVLDTPEAEQLGQFVRRRLTGEPLAHITGRQQFMHLEMLSGTQALIPRVETEQLAHACIDLLRQLDASAPARVIDVCTGSGNIAFAIAHHVETAIVSAADLSAEAIALAKRNGDHLALGKRVTFYLGDLMAPFETPDHLGCTDLIVCAPPYICTGKVEQMASEISEHEPRLAFDGGPFGVTILMRLIEDAPRFLRRGGWLAMEVGLGQGALLVKRLQANPAYRDVRGLADAGGAVRVVLARRQ